MKFCDLVAEQRKKKLMTQQELSSMVGISKQYICNIENGKYIPGLNAARRLIEVLDIPLELGVQCLKESRKENERKQN